MSGMTLASATMAIINKKKKVNRRFIIIVIR